MKAILKICGEAIVLTLIAGAVIGIIGSSNAWNTARAYSDAFFLASFLVITGGLAARLGTSQDTNQFRLLAASESFRKMNMSERLDLIANTRGSTNLVIVCLLSGVLLMIISELIAKMF